jgi:DNA-binding response OmpR family regulator
VNALLRRGAAADTARVVLKLGAVTLDVGEQRATVGGEPVTLTDREFLLAAYLLKNHGRLLTRQELLENVWHTHPGIVTRTVDTHISRLRAKLRLTPERGYSLATVYHKGYRLEYAPASAGGGG